ncbi:MAG TPA: DegQ family serine endoprotease [Candidatus Limnocylindrales bacterium]|nr:DegQ family serine endoprotease [Candidatus Limnocylindrales bacterium]
MSRSFFGLFTAVLGATAVLVVPHFTSWGRDSQPAFNVSATPINRDARLGTSFAPIVKKVAPSVVNIFTTRFVKERPMRNPMLNDPIFRQFFGDQGSGDNRERTRKEQSLGSGVIVSADGYILTANHVVDGADEIKVSIGDNKKIFTARVIGKDQATDVAVLKIEANNLPAVTLADSDQLEIGDIVLALGNPYGVGQSVTMGIVSALGRSGLPGFNQYQDFIQTDAAINPGNSGGALVDAEGRLVGINTAIISRSGGNQGIGFAVPINMARNVLERLVSGGKVTRGYLGIIPQDIDANLAKQFNLPDQNGALVGDVIADAPAAKAGLKSGDVILSVNGKPVADAHSLQLTVSQCAPGSAATIKFIRNGVNKTLVITLDALPGVSSESNDQNNPETGNAKTDALDGVTVADLDPQIRSLLRVPASIQGAIVTDVDSDSNSAEAGLQRNDLIVEINRQPVTGSDDAVRLCKAAKDDEILVKVWRRNGGFAGTRYLSVDNTKRPK